MSNNRFDRNIVVLGGVAVGKSSLITRFTKGEYDEKYTPTVSVNYNKKITVDGKEYNLFLSDTAGMILEQAGVDSVAMVLVGNKCDLKDDRQVSEKEAKELAVKFGCPYVETSSFEGTNVEELFVVAVRVANKSHGGSNDEEVGNTTDKPTMFQWIKNMWSF
ncbi:hypothetical protein GGI08_001185 [Coemansia sp. S2]|nr:hypothetical protein GGI08_001185 [Coemansia sp. S2]